MEVRIADIKDEHKITNFTIQRGKIQWGKKQLPACPVEVTLTLISNKWKILIMRDLLEGTKRFAEFKK